ncbi:MAG: hypothetical protein ACR2J3_03205 [Aridibacter sp.]
MDKYKIAVVVLDVEKSKIDYLLEILPTFKEEIDKVENGKVYLLEKD